MEQTKIRLLRVLSIIQETDEDHPITANQIVHQLHLYGMEAERKSVLRDIAALQDYGYSPCWAFLIFERNAIKLENVQLK